MLTLLAAPMAALPMRVAVHRCGGRGCFAVALLGGVMLTLLAAPMAALPVRVAVRWSLRLPIGVAGEGWVERPRRLRCWGGIGPRLLPNGALLVMAALPVGMA